MRDTTRGRGTRAKSRGIAWPSDQLIIAFLLTSVLLATIQLQTLGVAAFLAFVCFYAYVERRSLFANPNLKIIAILVGFGLLSAFWSIYPMKTLYYGIEIVITVLAALIISSSAQPYESLIGVTLCLIGHTLLSHLIGNYVPYEEVGRYVFVGLCRAKNYYGCVSGLTVLLSMGMAYAALARGQRWLVAVAVIGVIAGEAGLIRSLAMGFTLSCLACGLIMIYLNIYRKLPNRLRAGLMLYVIYALICSGVVLFLVQDSIVAMILKLTHKDLTFTGRTEIWLVARDAMKHYFWLGMGQSALWVPGNPYAEQIWAAHHIVGKRGFTLHNTAYELLVTTGVVGFVVHIAIAGWLMFNQIKALLKSPTTLQVTWFVVALFFFFLMGVESFVLSPVNCYTLAFLMGLTFHPAVPETAKKAFAPARSNRTEPMSLAS